MTKDQHKRPLGRGRQRLLYAAVGVLLLDLGVGQANGQIYPDPKMTKLFENRLEVLAKSHTRVFVSDCNLSRVTDEKAILTIPIGGTSGTLLLLSKGDVYNGSGVTYDANGVVLVDPGGGEWSQRKLQDIASQLSKLRFSLMQPQDLARLISEPSSNNCVGSAR
jgi:hypothetical protein